MIVNIKNKPYFYGIIFFLIITGIAFVLSSLIKIIGLEIDTSDPINLSLLILFFHLLASSFIISIVVVKMVDSYNLWFLLKVAFLGSVLNYMLVAVKTVIKLNAFDDYVLIKLLNYLKYHFYIFLFLFLVMLIFANLFKNLKWRE